MLQLRIGSGFRQRAHAAFKVAALPLALAVVASAGMADAPYADEEALPPDSVHVVPDRLSDIELLRADKDPFPIVDSYAWRAFIALNWPALPGADRRGEPDRAKTIGDPGPRVWESFRSRHELFQLDQAAKASPTPGWSSYDGLNPCGPNVDNREKTVAAFEPFKDFNQPTFVLRKQGNPLVAQNGTYVRYETRINQLTYDAIAKPGWSMGQNLPTPDAPARMPSGSIAVKAAWRVLTDADTPAIRARYYISHGANIVDVARTKASGKTVCTKADLALVGLHIVVRTRFRPQGIWSSFEHVDNVPAIGKGPFREPDARDSGAPYSFYNPDHPERQLWPLYGSPQTKPVDLANPPSLSPVPNQVVRRLPIHGSTVTLNRQVSALPGIKGTVWEHYMLVATQWPTVTRPVAPFNDSVFFPEHRNENLANTTMETYFQDRPANCMSCHHKVANSRGRDFVGIIDSFR
ncbi:MULTISPECIES: hypothetical protein [unclassified Novosphingobium]|uniref:hypothetical protein n=1 Tax=unclassified Novosphingobium TaxID=2644732 RepID=UPI0025DA322B|nr:MULTISPECIES: hypothetical protein [unclassified Novosphingobium]HQV04694.1 hypothetical protein [Novosphingobium sp.]